MSVQFIAGRDATGEEAQRVSDEAHAKALEGMSNWCRQALEAFLQAPDSHTRSRVKSAMKAVLRAVEARRAADLQKGEP